MNGVLYGCNTSDVYFGRTDYKGLKVILIPPNSGELKIITVPFLPQILFLANIFLIIPVFILGIELVYYFLDIIRILSLLCHDF